MSNNFELKKTFFLFSGLNLNEEVSIIRPDDLNQTIYEGVDSKLENSCDEGSSTSLNEAFHENNLRTSFSAPVTVENQPPKFISLGTTTSNVKDK